MLHARPMRAFDYLHPLPYSSSFSPENKYYGAGLQTHTSEAEACCSCSRSEHDNTVADSYQASHKKGGKDWMNSEGHAAQALGSNFQASRLPGTLDATDLMRTKRRCYRSEERVPSKYCTVLYCRSATVSDSDVFDA